MASQRSSMARGIVPPSGSLPAQSPMDPDDSTARRDSPAAPESMIPAADAPPGHANHHSGAFHRTARTDMPSRIGTWPRASGGEAGAGRGAATGGIEKPGDERAGHLVDRVVALMSLGLGVEDCSRRLGMPTDLVDLAARHARAEGRLPAVPAMLPCGPGSCRPDPSSLLCAGCPLAPSSGRSVLAAAAGGALRGMRIGASRLMRGHGA